MSADRDSAGTAVKVIIYRAGCYCGSEVFTVPEILIGRDRASDLQLECELVSRAHAVIRVDPWGVKVEDSGSHNGVRLNGQKVFSARPQKDDQVTIGTFTLRFVHYGRSQKRPIREVARYPLEREITQVESPPRARRRIQTAVTSMTAIIRAQSNLRRLA